MLAFWRRDREQRRFMADVGGLRVGLDGFNLAMARGTGVATYGRALSHALKAMGYGVDVLYGLNVSPNAPADLRETLFFAALSEGRSGGEAPAKITLRRAFERAFPWPQTRNMVEIPITGRVISDAMAGRLPAFDRIFSLPSLFYLGSRYFRRYGKFMPVRIPDPPAIMHWTYPLPIRLDGARNIYTLHDLVPLRLPFTSLEDRTYYDHLLRVCVATADHLCTVSECSRRDIIALLGADPDRVTNTYQAVAPTPATTTALTQSALAERLRTLFDLQAGGYFLFFGAIEPKKNLGRLIEAYLAADLATPFVIAGPRAWQADSELRLIEGAHGVALKGAERIRRIDFLPADQLTILVRGAKAVLFPALYEGFGLPALEAMALGAPLMASNAGSLPEIVGKAALLIDPYDVAAMVSALRQLDGDGALRSGLSVAGLERAKAFSMPVYQDRLQTFYQGVMAQPIAG